MKKRVDEKFSFDSIIGKSKTIQQAVELAKKVAPNDTSVLLTGETGTGKEVFAQALHHASSRSGKIFCCSKLQHLQQRYSWKVNYSDTSKVHLPEAVKDKKGLIEEANGGTLFLDEIGEMPMELQAKLLRVLETNEFIKLGETKSSKVNVRLITATNRDLQKEVDEGKFREDLFYRLNIFTIELPPLRDRKKDIPALANYFLQLYSSKINGHVTGMSKEFMDHLIGHDWKGNIRELKNVMERAVILTTDNELTVSSLPIDFHTSRQKGQALSAFELSSMEKLHIQRVLNHTHGNKMAAARLLNIGLTTLYRKIEEYKIT